MAYLLISIILPAFLIFVFSTVVPDLFGRSLGVRRLYVRVLLPIFQYASKHQTNFTIGCKGEETDGEEEANVSVSSTPSTISLPSSWTPSPIEEQPQATEISDQVNCLSLVSIHRHHHQSVPLLQRNLVPQ